MSRVFVFFFLVVGFIFSAYAEKTVASLHPLKFYVDMAIGQQDIMAQSQQTVMAGNQFLPYDRKDLMERVAFGYVMVPFLAAEAGVTFFSGYGYGLSPLDSTINHSIFSFELLLKIILSYNRLHFYIVGGPALIYSGVGGFHVDAGEFTTDDTSEIDAHWPNTYFVRPEAGVGIGVDVTRQIRLGAVYAMIFGTGTFGSSININQASEPELVINQDYLPNMQYVAANITFMF